MEIVSIYLVMLNVPSCAQWLIITTKMLSTAKFVVMELFLCCHIFEFECITFIRSITLTLLLSIRVALRLFRLLIQFWLYVTEADVYEGFVWDGTNDGTWISFNEFIFCNINGKTIYLPPVVLFLLHQSTMSFLVLKYSNMNFAKPNALNVWCMAW